MTWFKVIRVNRIGFEDFNFVGRSWVMLFVAVIQHGSPVLCDGLLTCIIIPVETDIHILILQVMLRLNIHVKVYEQKVCRGIHVYYFHTTAYWRQAATLSCARTATLTSYAHTQGEEYWTMVGYLLTTNNDIDSSQVRENLTLFVIFSHSMS